jgi:hypothetical protein
VKPSVLIVAISFFFYVTARLVGPTVTTHRRQSAMPMVLNQGTADLAELQDG